MIIFNTPQAADIVHGGWLLAIVGAESLVTLGSAIATALHGFSPAFLVLLHMIWGIGLGLYGIFIVLFSRRMFLLAVDADDVTASLWIVMGAAAISANAGSALVLSNSEIPFLHSMRPFVDGMTLLVWAWATWWIPLLLLLGLWKHGVRRKPLTYTPLLWSLVFPLGMYSLATFRLALTAGFPPLRVLSHAMSWIALAAWATTAAAFVATTWRSFRQFKQAWGDPRSPD
jgi:tellurite resistance protein TehA-like permease